MGRHHSFPIQTRSSMRSGLASTTAESDAERWGSIAGTPSQLGVVDPPENPTVIYQDASIRVVSAIAIPGSVENPDHRRIHAVFVVGSYKALSSTFFEDRPGSYVHDPDVATLRETDVEFVLGWPDVLETWKDMPFASSAERSFVMRKLAIKICPSITQVAAVGRVRRQMESGESFMFSALGINVQETRGDKWLIVHHHARPTPRNLTS